jgi:bifunctional enzyme CysN/CysC
VRRAGEVAKMFAESGAVALISLISPCAADRLLIRTLHEEAGLPFVEVYLDTPLDECERRDVKGLYARARAGQLPGFTGIDGVYEIPERAELVLRPTSGTVAEQAGLVIALVTGRLA